MTMISLKSPISSIVSTVFTRAFVHRPNAATLRHLCSAPSQVPPPQPSTNRQSFKHAALSDRAVIRVTGKDASSFLQGILTNDVNQLLSTEANSRRCLYTFMLNTAGRIVADMFVYSLDGSTESFLLEVDAKMVPAVSLILKRYKIRRKISVAPEANCRITAIYPDSPESIDNQPVTGATAESSQLIVPDPRSHHFGYRLLSLESADPALVLNTETGGGPFAEATLKLSYANDYRRFRYRQGIGEGVVDFPPEAVFPFEANAEMLNAVSLTKGCYIGQELTARTYHTGVIRKRLLPIELHFDDDAKVAVTLPTQNVILVEPTDDEDAPKKIMGRFRVNFGRAGLATLKHGELFTDDTTECTTLKLDKSGHQLRTWRPFWWPEEIYQKFNQKF